MDGSDTRRGQPAMHRRFAAQHRTAAWRGDADSFGTAIAILLGDMCLIWADEMLNTAGLPPEQLLRGRPVYDEMRTEIMAGQYLDILGQVTGDRSVEGAMNVIRYKSAKYTVERPLHLGATLAGGSPRLVAAYSAYGLPLGEAFQLRDDVLGVFGDPAQTGKPAGDDLREGKRTVLVAKTLERATPAESAYLEQHLGRPDLDVEGRPHAPRADHHHRRAERDREADRRADRAGDRRAGLRGAGRRIGRRAPRTRDRGDHPQGLTTRRS